MMLLIGRLKPNFYISRLPEFEYPAGANNWFIKYGKRNQRIKKFKVKEG
jgi:hypothetical protein